MQEQNERQTIPTAQTIFVRGQGGRSPEVKRCGYCDRLVRWTILEGRNVAVNCDGSRHQCLTDGTAKRKQPGRHDRPSPDEVAEFLAPEKAETCHEQVRPEPECDYQTEELQANTAAWKAQTEAVNRLADAMTKVAQSNNAIAESNLRLAKMYGRLAHAMERAGHTCR